jgi:hypothetical protein
LSILHQALVAESASLKTPPERLCSGLKTTKTFAKVTITTAKTKQTNKQQTNFNQPTLRRGEKENQFA